MHQALVFYVVLLAVRVGMHGDSLHLTHIVRASMCIAIYYSRVVVWFWRKTWTRWFVRHKVRDKFMGYAKLR